MQNHMKTFLYTCTLCMLAVSIGCFGFAPVFTQAAESAQAAESTRTAGVAELTGHSITLKCATADNSRVFKEEKFWIYDVKDYETEITENESEAAKKLSKIVMDETNPVTPLTETQTDASGQTTICLENGRYLFCGETVTDESGIRYQPIPFLLNIDNHFSQDLTSYVKYEEEKTGKDEKIQNTQASSHSKSKNHTEITKKSEKRTKVKTGDLNDAVRYLLMMIGSLTVIGIVMHVTAKGHRQR